MRNWKTKISEHIPYTEATKSRTAIKYNIDNTPSPLYLINMRYIAKNLFEPIRNHFDVPIAITSFYRSEALNKRLKGSKNSAHMKGEAIDMDADVMGLISNKDIFDYIKNNLEFDQLIWEFGTKKEPAWVHVSLKRENNRKEILVSYKEKNFLGKSITKYKYI